MTLSPERWARVDALFEAVLERPAAEREAYLVQATSGDEDLLQRVRALVDALDTSERYVRESAADHVVVTDVAVGGPVEGEEADAPLEVGERLGPWQVEREIGRGGMGAVYLATRADGAFDRTVAVKLVHSRRKDPDGAHFLAERRILAALEHDGIARLYDTGTTSDGRPYLVMEHVDGTPLDRWADARTLDLEGRLRLFGEVCEAVAYAHHHLVVHRDLKPANILVTGAGRVKLLDFGIARLVGSPESAGPSASLPRHLTPEYAAPEQLRGDPMTAATDVYSLGVVLHELLCGHRPPWQPDLLFGGKSDDGTSATAPPSHYAQRGNDSSGQTSVVAAARATSPTRLARQLSGDLDAIVLKALDPDPSQRYASVESLREDVLRVLTRHPIRARPASLGLRARKFTRRHRGASTAGALVILLASAYVTTIVVQSRRIASERDLARAAQDRSEQVVQLLSGLFEAADPMAPDRRDTLSIATLLDEGAIRVERELVGEPAVQAELFAVLAGVQRSLGRTDPAVRLAERSVALRRGEESVLPVDLARSLVELARARTARSQLPAASAALDEARRLQEAFASGDLALRILILQHLGHAEMSKGSLPEAEALFSEALALVEASAPVDSLKMAELLNHMAVAAQRGADYDSARVLTTRAVAIESRWLGDDHPRTLVDRVNLGFLTDRAGQPADAVPLLEAAVAEVRRRLPSDHPLLANGLMTLSRAQLNTGDPESAAAAVTEAVAAHRSRSGAPHIELAFALDYLGSVESRRGRFDGAEAALVEAHNVFARLLGPTHVNSAIALARVAAIRCDRRRTDAPVAAALASFDGALRELDASLPEAHPQRVNWNVARASCLDRAGRGAEAERALLEWYEVALRSLGPEDAARRNAVREAVELFERRGDTARAADLRARAGS